MARNSVVLPEAMVKPFTNLKQLELSHEEQMIKRAKELTGRCAMVAWWVQFKAFTGTDQVAVVMQLIYLGIN